MDYITAFLLLPAALSGWMILGFLLIGILLIGVGSEMLSGLALLGLLYLVLGGGTVIAGSLAAGGLFTLLLWVLLAVAFLYMLGMNLNKQRTFRFGMLLVFLFSITMTVYYHLYAMSFGGALAATLATTAVYVGIGFAVAFLWKWPKYNRESNERMFEQQAQWVTHNIAASKRPVPVPAKDGERFRDRRGELVDEDQYKFDDAERAALLTLDKLTAAERGRQRMHADLMPRWNAYRRSNSIVAPSLMRSKALFTTWVLGWPGIVAYEALFDIVEALGRWLSNFLDWAYARMGGALRRTQERLLGDRSDLLDLPPDEPVKPTTPPTAQAQTPAQAAE